MNCLINRHETSFSLCVLGSLWFNIFTTKAPRHQVFLSWVGKIIYKYIICLTTYIQILIERSLSKFELTVNTGVLSYNILILNESKVLRPSRTEYARSL
jgi:ABC-type uncharacterized transport system permease subunit